MTLLMPSRPAHPDTPTNPDTDDVVLARNGVNALAHREWLDGQPACGAQLPGKPVHHAAGHARRLGASPCRRPQCFPTGWPF